VTSRDGVVAFLSALASGSFFYALAAGNGGAPFVAGIVLGTVALAVIGERRGWWDEY
jgi:hypothetical protein